MGDPEKTPEKPEDKLYAKQNEDDSELALCTEAPEEPEDGTPQLS